MPDNKPSFMVGSGLITAAGTAEQLASQAIPQGHALVLKNRRTNTGYMYHGPTKAIAELHHFEIGPNESVTLNVDNLNSIWLDVSVNGEFYEWQTEVSG